MSELVIDAGFFNPVKFYELEKLIISTVSDIMHSESIDSLQISELDEAVKEYFFLLSCSSHNQTAHIKIESLLRILRFLLEYPIENRVDISFVEILYGDYGLLDLSTFGVYQTCAKSINEKTIDCFMDYVKGSSIEKLSAFFLFRLNPDYVRTYYQYDNVNEMTTKELYYSISTGYYKIELGTNAAIKRLAAMSAHDELDRLIRDGFWIIT